MISKGVNRVYRKVTGKKGAGKPIPSRKAHKPKPKKVFRNKTAKKVDDCCKEIRNLQKSDKQSRGTMIYRDLQTDAWIASANERHCELLGVPVDTTKIESILTKLRFFDPSAPATLIESSAVAGTYQRSISIKNITQSVTVYNNYQSKYRIRIYLATVKDDTNNTAIDSITSGILDNCFTDAGVPLAKTNLQWYPSDVNLLGDLYKIKLVSDTYLNPGQSVNAKTSWGPFEYDSSTVDTHGLKYQKAHKAQHFFAVAEGIVGHTATFQTSLVPFGLDVNCETTFKVEYNAGINVSYVVANLSSLDDPTGTVFQSFTPATAQQAYSV
jgi:hypothetical protein